MKINDHFWSREKTKLEKTKINEQIWSWDIQTKNDHITIGHYLVIFSCVTLAMEKYSFDNEFVQFTKF